MSDPHQTLAAYLEEDERLLLQSLGRFEPAIRIAGAIDDEEAEQRGANRLETILIFCREKICETWRNHRTGSRLELAMALHDLLATFLNGYVVGLISAVIVKRGLQQLCEGQADGG